MGIFDKLKSVPFLDLIQDQRLKELVTRREFRLSEEYLHREFLSRAEDAELTELGLKLEEGFATLSGKLKKAPLPFAIPFAARFAVHSVDFSGRGKLVHLKLEEVKPLDLDWVTRKLVGKVPFLSYADRLLACDLTKVPRLAELFACRVRGFYPADYLVLKELSLRKGEVVGRLGLCL